ncbi:restriction endonuclease subunit S [Staphylococcus hominis]|uniref:restriction endonuclease subunit S n=1 Tax=Staphylococcus hominis TaxID=1290 RepID=UPI0021D17C32|nr:restriction endonuclease subunit S [Staphylococcus hominis]UXR84596.1 restriction endonuclease subunit S [Staphylococcus hominis]
MTEQKNSPALRFPEFKENWKEFSLEDKSDLITKGTTPKEWDKNGEVNFIKVENIEEHSGKVKTTSKISYHEHSTHLKRSILEEGDILFSIAGTLGRITIINKEILPANTNQALAIIRNTSINKYYLKTYLLGKSIKEYIRKNPTVGAQPNLSLKQIKSFKIKTPDFIEQEKIGTFFSKLDRQIELEEKKLELLEQQKKGYMQQIFSQDLRFKDENGDDYAAWKETTIKEIAEIKTGSKDTKDAREDGNYNFYVRSPIIHKINSYSYDGEAILTVGDGVGVGKVFHYVNGKFDYHQRVYKISDFKNYYGLLLYYYFSKNFLKEARKYNAKTSVDSVRKDMIANMKVPMPIMEEQQKIGMFLKKLESRIDYQNSKIKLLKQRKRGFLQKMFV